MLHAAAQRAATQQERVHDERRRRFAKNDRAGETVAAEAVGDVDRQALLGEALDFRRGAADAGGIHLVGALRELRDAVHLRGLHRCDRDFELQRREEIFEAGARCASARARSARWAYISPRRRSSSVTRARSKAQTCAQEVGDLRGARGQQQRQHLGSAGLHFLHFLGIVVDQDERIEAEFQLFGERCEIAGLGIPVDALRHEIAEAQRHFRMSAERVDHILFVVLAAQREQHALRGGAPP